MTNISQPNNTSIPISVGLGELLHLLGERPHVEITPYVRDSASIAYTFPWCPAWKQRVRFSIEETSPDIFRIRSWNHSLYSSLPSGDFEGLDWRQALDIALSWVRVWEDTLHPPQEPTFGMSLATATRKDALLVSVKAAALKAAVKGERSANWLEYEGQDGLHRHFTPEELRNLLDINVLVEHRDGRYDWYLNW